MKPAPRFIVLEGIDGSGTTTQAVRLREHLQKQGRPVHTTAEPSTGPIGKLLREILLGNHKTESGAPVAGGAMALMFAADRVDHLAREIEPKLAAGFDVISDRYLMSSLAYQAEEADRDWVQGLARNLRQPTLTLLLDIPIEVAAARRKAAGRPVERYDADGFLAKVAANYRELAARMPNTVVIDATGTLDEVTAAIVRAVEAT